MTKTYRQERLIAKIYSEGYCCMSGYLRLCRARGERVVDMAENLSLSPMTIWAHMRQMKEGKHACKHSPECLQPIIEEIEASPKPPPRDIE